MRSSRGTSWSSERRPDGCVTDAGRRPNDAPPGYMLGNAGAPAATGCGRGACIGAAVADFSGCAAQGGPGRSWMNRFRTPGGPTWFSPLSGLGLLFRSRFPGRPHSGPGCPAGAVRRVFRPGFGASALLFRGELFRPAEGRLDVGTDVRFAEQQVESCPCEGRADRGADARENDGDALPVRHFAERL